MKHDFEQAERFIEAIKGSHQVESHFCSFAEKKKVGRVHEWDDTLENMKDNISKVNKAGGTQSLYFGINDLAEGQTKLKADNIGKINALWIDIDDMRPELPEFPIEPSIIVRSSVHGKWHVYWLVDDCPVNQGKLNQTRLIQFYGSDPSPKDISRVMRLPGTIHNGGDPVLCTLLKCDKSIRYSLQEIIDAHPVADLVASDDHGLRTVETHDDLDEYYEWAMVISKDVEEGIRHKTAQRVANEGKALSASENEVYTVTQAACEQMGIADRQNGKEAELLTKWAFANLTDKWKPSLVAVGLKVKTKALIKLISDRRDKNDIFENGAFMGQVTEAQFNMISEAAKDHLNINKGDMRKMRKEEKLKIQNAKNRREKSKAIENGGFVADSYGAYDDIAEEYRRLNYLRYYREEWFTYEDGSYRATPTEEFKAFLRRWLVERVMVINDQGFPEKFQANTNAILQIEASLRSLCLVRSDVDLPCWIGANEKDTIINFKNGLLRLESRELIKHTHKFFSVAQLSFDYDPEAKAPTFEQSMMQWFPNDNESIILTQKIMGYLISSDTSRQKLFMFIGGSRTGKSTLTNVIQRLVPEARSTSLSSLGGEFGLEPLVHAQLAIIGDAHLGNTDRVRVLSVLKNTSGEDTQPVNRKNKAILDVKIKARILMATNEIHGFVDPSGALAKRTVPVCFDHSFYGKESFDLQERLQAELSGICVWALKGLDKLTKGGVFDLPDKSKAVVSSMQDISSPITSFYRDCVTVDEKSHVTPKDMYLAYDGWTAAAGETRVSKNKFEDIFCNLNGDRIKPTRPMTSKGRAKSAYWGFKLVAVDG